MVNVYVSSGTARSHERETFYNSELTSLLRVAPSHMTVGRDFNCVLNKKDCTGQMTVEHSDYFMVLNYTTRGKRTRQGMFSHTIPRQG